MNYWRHPHAKEFKNQTDISECCAYTIRHFSTLRPPSSPDTQLPDCPCQSNER